MDNKKSNGNKFRILYKESQNYRKLAVNGAIGSPTPQGDLLVSFYLETRVVPDEVEIQLDESGKKIDESTNTGQYAFVRELQVGVFLSPESARSIGEFLIRNAERLSKAKTEQDIIGDKKDE